MTDNVTHKKMSKIGIKSVVKKSVTSLGQTFSRMRMRRQSYGFSTLLGIGGKRRMSQMGLEYKRPPLLFLNTYQLNPRVRFHVPSVQKNIDEVLDAYFTDHKYSFSESPGLTMTIASEVMRNVKSLCFDRYRIIAVVTMAQKRAQCYNNAVAFLWDHERDNIVNVQREATTVFIQVTVFGVYLD